MGKRHGCFFCAALACATFTAFATASLYPMRGISAMGESGTNGVKEIQIQNRRYLGSKYKLVDEIRRIVTRYCKGATVFADVFAGTGVVAAAFPEMRLVTNDILYSNYICHQAWFLPVPYSARKVADAIKAYNAMSADEDNYMSLNFADTYFSLPVCRKIGSIREDIEARFKSGGLNVRERALLITSLLYAMDKIANTVGHYDAYRKGVPNDAALEMRMPVPPEGLDGGNACFNEDANALVRCLKCDILFLDPPYNSRQYSDAYHLLENVARWEKPPVKGVARKMDRSGLKSDYCTKSAETAFADLIDSADAKYMILTYNNMENQGNARSNARLSDKAILENQRQYRIEYIFLSTGFDNKGESMLECPHEREQFTKF